MYISYLWKALGTEMLSVAGEFPAAAGSGAINSTGREARCGGGAGGRFPALPPPAAARSGPGDAGAEGGRQGGVNPRAACGSRQQRQRGEGVMANTLELKTGF